jgi:hypothetical protein
VARHALLIEVSEFADPRLARLNAPTNDVIALRGILQDSSRGSFDSVELSVNEDFLAVRDHLSRFFHDRAPDDLLLLYYSGHGILGPGNRLFLATAGSNLDTPRGRSVSSQEIRDFIADCRAERQIVVLDCCHSGASAYRRCGLCSAAICPGRRRRPRDQPKSACGLFADRSGDHGGVLRPPPLPDIAEFELVRC